MSAAAWVVVGLTVVCNAVMAITCMVIVRRSS